jgi:para-aminobenzoate synthetase component 1
VAPVGPVPDADVPIPDRGSSPILLRSRTWGRGTAGRGISTLVAAEPAEVVVADGADALAVLDDLEPGWWAGYLSYDLGRAVEAVRTRLPADKSVPDLVLARYDARLVVDQAGSRLEGAPRARQALDRLLERAPAVAPVAPLGEPVSSLDRAAFEAGVRAIIGLIENGDCYQVNLTRRLTWDQPVDPVALHGAVARVNPSPRTALLELPGPRAPIGIVSATPECFLRWRGRAVETLPIKGTGTDACALRASAKDRAENVMIVDLARNDLGRVCEFGSVEVTDLLHAEAHPGLVHLVSTVRGRRRNGTGLGSLVRATFPPASVTGAPKPGVLQAIEDLEPVRRGVYCGAIGWLDTTRDEGDLSVAIRTFTIADDSTTLGVGGGIVADSRPADEWAETELKVAQLLRAAGAARTANAATNGATRRAVSTS